MVELKQVDAGYDGKEIIKSVNISFKEGEITSIIGKNGCGKTTLLKVASRQMKPYQGEVLLDGKNIYDYENKELAKKVSFLPQARNIPQISVQALVLHGRFPYLTFPRNPSAKDNEIAENAMKTVGVWKYQNKNINELSGGERQKVYIAMVLAQDTDIVFLDEPTTYLDINQQLEILCLMKNLKQLGKTVIMVIHDISAALCYSDKVCLMDHGEIVIYESPQAVYESKEIERVFHVTCEHVSNNSCIEGFLFGLQ